MNIQKYNILNIYNKKTSISSDKLYDSFNKLEIFF